MDYVDDDIYLDIKGYKFEMRADTFDSEKCKKHHNCFCDNKTRDIDTLDCLDDGLFDLHNCVGELYFFLSILEHFQVEG